MARFISILNCWVERQIAMFLVLLLAVPLAQSSTMPRAPQDQSAQTHQQASNANAPTGPPELPNAPENHTAPQSSNSQNTQTAPAQQATQSAPVGTAAAPAETPVGTAVSRPAGAAIAPAKQKRTRTFLIRVGLVVGAAVAVGTVVALSKASRSRPQ